MFPLHLSANSEKIVTIYKDVNLQALVEEMARGCKASWTRPPSKNCAQCSHHCWAASKVPCIVFGIFSHTTGPFDLEFSSNN